MPIPEDVVRLPASDISHTDVTQDDPIIEFEDEFGRVRSARRSEVPRHLLPNREKGEDGDECVICP